MYKTINCKHSFSVTSNWSTLGNADLGQIVFEDTSDSKGINIEDIKADKCVCLINSNKDENSKVYIEVEVNGYLTNLCLISEAQTIEVFGVNDEYLLTHTGDFFDDWEEMAVYQSQITLPNIPVCKLKVTRTRNKNRLWLYGAKLHIEEIESQHNESSKHFNFKNINRLLGNTKFSTLNKAHNFKNFLEAYSAHFPNFNLGHCSTRTISIKKPGQCCISQNKQTEERDENSATEEFSVLTINTKDAGNSQSNVLLNDAVNNNWFVSYIDRKFYEIKKDILREVDIKLSILKEENNHKLDKIISLLENHSAKI